MRPVAVHRRPGLALRAILLTAAMLSGCVISAEPPAWLAEAPPHVPRLPEGMALVGLEGGTVRSLLGRPNVARDEKRAHLWRYDLGRCQLDLVFYPDPRTGRQQVAYANVRPSSSRHRAAGCGEVARRLRVASFEHRGHPDSDAVGSSGHGWRG